MPRNPLNSPLEHQQSLDDMRRKYRAERDKRLSADRSDLLDLKGELAHYLDDPYLQAAPRRPIRDHVDAVVVGAGFGGLLSGAYLRKAGVNRIRLIDRAGGVGGVWYWNRYPGAMCDVESYIYLPLLEEFGYIPSDKYALGADIRAHAEMIARRYRLDSDALLQTSVTGARWDEVLRRWEVTTDRGDVISTQFLVLANGALSKLKLPDLPGLETFQGHAFHTSRWDYSYTGGDARGDLTGLRDQVVGIVGTGASAVQCVPPLGRSAKHLYVFQRTPSTVAVRANRPTDPEWAQSLEAGWQYRRMVNFTTLVTGGYDDVDLVKDGWTDVYRDVLMSPKFAGLSPAEAAKAVELADLAKMEGVRARVEQIVRDPATAEALKPYYRYLCKRPAFHDEFLDAFNYPNVTLVDTLGKGLERVYEHGVVANGVKFDLDGLIFATGFEFGTLYTHRIGFDLVGRDGLKLSDKWSPGMVSLHGVTTHGFPNLLVLPGPGSQSSISVNLIHALWENAAHIGYIVGRTREEGHKTFEVTEAAENEWVQALLASVGDNSAYLADCTPGRKNNEGRPADRSRQNVDYGKGPIAFYKLLREWRDEGSLAGITFGDLTRAKRTFARNIAPPGSAGPYVKRRTGPYVKRGFRVAGKRCILCPHVRLLFGIGMPWQVVLTSAMSNARRLSAADSGLTGAGSVWIRPGGRPGRPAERRSDRLGQRRLPVPRRSVVRNMVAAAGLLCLLAACSSGSSASSSGATTPAAASGSGKTLTVEVACQISGPQVEPECATSVEAYFDMVNAAGGVDGYKLKVATCDTQTNPVLDADCTKSAVANPAIVALVGRGGGISPIPQYQIADIAPIVDNPAMATATNSFILTPYSAAPTGDPGSNTTQAKLLAKGVNKPGMIACSLSGCLSHVNGTKAWYAAYHISVKVVTAPLTAVDFTPQIVALQHAGVNGIIVVEGAAGIDGAIKAAVAQNYHPAFLLSTACDDARALQGVPDVPDVYCSIPFNPSPAARAPYTQLMNKYIGAGKWAMSGWGLNSYLGAQLFVQDVRGINGPVTRAAVLAGMRKITDFSSPLLGTTIDFGQPGPIAKYPAFVNWYYFFSAIKNHAVVPVAPAAIDAAP